MDEDNLFSGNAGFQINEDAIDFSGEYEDENEPAQLEEAQPEQPEPETVSAEEYNRLKQDTERLKRWQDDALKSPELVRQISEQHNNYEPQLTAEQMRDRELSDFVNNTVEYRERLIQEAEQRVSQRMQAERQQQEAQQLRNEILAEHTWAAPYEVQLFSDAQRIWQNAQASGKSISEKAAVTQAINEFQAGLSTLQNPTLNQQKGREAMRLDVTGAKPASTKLTPEAIQAMSADDFEAHRANIMRNY